MSVPGDNILLDALDIIGSTAVMYYGEASREPGPRGIWLVTYSPGVLVVTGSVQAVPKNNYKQFGLDFAQKAVMWYVPLVDVESLARNKSGDVFEVFEERFQMNQDTSWKLIDGWAQILGVKIGPATGALTNA